MDRFNFHDDVMISTASPKRVSAMLVGAAVVFVSACSSLPHHARIAHEGAMIAHAGHGDVPPTVVFQSGLGDGMSVWAAVMRKLPPTVSTFAYDRPGYGGSDARPGTRDPCTIARELREVLRASNRKPPYVLVGHSLGGLYQYAFAKLHPREVAGVLLIDATHPDHWATLQQRAAGTAAMLRGIRAVGFSPTERREFDAQAECLADLRSRDTPRVPARLLVRGKADLGESAEFQALSRELVSRWPSLMPGMSVSRIEGAGHYIQKDRPELVADEIGKLVAGASPGRL